MQTSSAPIGSHPGFPYRSHPAGWFQIGWSAEVPVGAVLARTYFDRDLAVYRTADETLHVVDAHCPHMGADLSHGGRVEGDCLVCPFHAWRWDSTGSVAAIPYSQHLNSSRRLRRWPVREVNGVVFLWHHPFGEPPTHDDPIPTIDELEEYYPVFPYASGVEELRMPPQLVTENAVDIGHLLAVHRWTDATLISYDVDDRCFSTAFTGWIPTRRGGVQETTVLRCCGVGILYAENALAFDDGDSTEYSATCATPTTAGHSKLFSSSWVRREPGAPDEPSGRAATLIAATKREVFEHDGPIWEHLRYESQPAYAFEEAKPFAAFRHWAVAHYPAG